MIVSHRHKFIFVAIPKTATHAVRAVLRPQLARHDWEQCILFEKRAFPVKSLATFAHGHLTCQQVRPYLLPSLWQQYEKFCFVRNPYSRFISLCTFLSRDNDAMQREPIGRMKQLIQETTFQQRLLAQPQAHFVCDADGTLLVDAVGRFESIRQDLDRILGELNLEKSTLPRRNASQNHFPVEKLDAELTELIQKRYQIDFQLFDYATTLEQGL